jgi:hypothetical protein
VLLQESAACLLQGKLVDISLEQVKLGLWVRALLELVDDLLKELLIGLM